MIASAARSLAELVEAGDQGGARAAFGLLVAAFGEGEAEAEGDAGRVVDLATRRKGPTRAR
jgi:hypothetical protein